MLLYPSKSVALNVSILIQTVVAALALITRERSAWSIQPDIA